MIERVPWPMMMLHAYSAIAKEKSKIEVSLLQDLKRPVQTLLPVQPNNPLPNRYAFVVNRTRLGVSCSSPRLGASCSSSRLGVSCSSPRLCAGWRVGVSRLLLRRGIIFKQFFLFNLIQWNPSITDTLGTQNFVRYNEVSLSQGFPVYFW